MIFTAKNNSSLKRNHLVFFLNFNETPAGNRDMFLRESSNTSENAESIILLHEKVQQIVQNLHKKFKLDVLFREKLVSKIFTS